MKYYRKILISIYFFCILFADLKIENKNILKVLYEDNYWNLKKITEDSLYIYSKNVEGMDLVAFRVNKKVSIDPMEIINVISDIENYENFITNSGSLKTEKISQLNGALDVYQHITIDIPFFSNRDYFYRMIANKEALHNNKLIEWHLLELEDIIDRDFKKDPNATYLQYGAGMWLSVPLENGVFDISYRLVMDPGGYIPDILVEILNEVALVNLFKDVLKEATFRTNKSYR